VNSEHKVDVYKDGKKIKKLDIEYMRCSLYMNGQLYIGTEEQTIFMVKVPDFEVIDKVGTQSYAFAIEAIDNETLVVG
jgi:predicted RNA-binding protein